MNFKKSFFSLAFIFVIFLGVNSFPSGGSIIGPGDILTIIAEPLPYPSDSLDVPDVSKNIYSNYKKYYDPASIASVFNYQLEQNSTEINKASSKHMIVAEIKSSIEGNEILKRYKINLSPFFSSKDYFDYKLVHCTIKLNHLYYFFNLSRGSYSPIKLYLNILSENTKNEFNALSEIEMMAGEVKITRDYRTHHLPDVLSVYNYSFVSQLNKDLNVKNQNYSFVEFVYVPPYSTNEELQNFISTLDFSEMKCFIWE